MLDTKPMLNAYPDSMGGTLQDMVSILAEEDLRDAFSTFYILPSLFHSDLDRGFSVIDYDLETSLATKDDLDRLRSLGIQLKLDFVLNHASVNSPQFRDILERGTSSPSIDFFLDWNHMWQGHGTMTEDGYIEPDSVLIKDMFFRKPGLPILMVHCHDGSNIPFWNTFYQERRYPHVDSDWLNKYCQIRTDDAQALANEINNQLDNGIAPRGMTLAGYPVLPAGLVETLESQCGYLGQMDLNVASPLVWDFYRDTLKKLASYGASVVRLDAFAYASKAVGSKNFFNEPETWEILQRLKDLAGEDQLELLPEIHASYAEGRYREIARKGYMTYDFFLPGLMIDALEATDGSRLVNWANEIVRDHIRTVNMLGCHDGIPMLDLKGLLPETRIQELIDLIVARGGYVKNLHGQQNTYYQVNATYFSALGESERKLLLARAIQLFMPGKPQIWYLDLFAGKNDLAAIQKAGAGNHKEINRTNLTIRQIRDGLQEPVVRQQLEMLRFRNNCPSFGEGAKFYAVAEGTKMSMSWEKDDEIASLNVDFDDFSFSIRGVDEAGKPAILRNDCI